MKKGIYNFLLGVPPLSLKNFSGVRLFITIHAKKRGIFIAILHAGASF